MFHEPFFVFMYESKNSYDNSIFEIKSIEEQPIIDFKLLDFLDESNKKTIELSNVLFDLTKDVKTLQLLVRIRKNHEKIDFELNNLTDENLIIIPKLTNPMGRDSAKCTKGDLYLLKTLETELKNQITVFEKIEKTSQNIDFRIFAIQSKKAIVNNNEVLKRIIQNHRIQF